MGRWLQELRNLEDRFTDKGDCRAIFVLSSFISRLPLPRPFIIPCSSQVMSQSATDTGGDIHWVFLEDFNQPSFAGDPRINRTIISRLREVLVLKSEHRSGKWGFAIVRTAYGPGSDEQFQYALDLIRRTAQVYVDTEISGAQLELSFLKADNPLLEDTSTDVDKRLNEEILSRFENDVLEDKELLQDASVAAVRQYFSDWIASKHGFPHTGNLRYCSCILLDTETLAQLATVPEDFPRYGSGGTKSPYWFKMVDVAPNPEGSFRVRVFGEFGLVEYWFRRNSNRRAAIEVIHQKDPDDPSICYFGY